MKKHGSGFQTVVYILIGIAIAYAICLWLWMTPGRAELTEGIVTGKSYTGPEPRFLTRTIGPLSWTEWESGERFSLEVTSGGKTEWWDVSCDAWDAAEIGDTVTR